MAGIDTASKEQAARLTRINQGLGQLESVVRQNATYAGESASASDALSGQADQLRRIFERYHDSRDFSAPPLPEKQDPSPAVYNKGH